jgi:hypothetical protein
MGCELTDFDGITDKIALIMRGGCDFSLKAVNAKAAGAVGVIVYNVGDVGAILGSLLDVDGVSGSFPPVVGISYDDGMALLAGESEVSMSFETTVLRDPTISSNFILKTKAGSTDSGLLVTAYRDSEPGSPGVNDALSSPSALLTLAKAMMETEFEPKNQITFLLYSGFHSGETDGQNWFFFTSDEEPEAIALAVSAIASPNYIRYFYSQSQLATDFIRGSFENLGLTYAQPFEPNLTPGALPYIELSSENQYLSGNKTAEEAIMFGGEAGEPYSPW